MADPITYDTIYDKIKNEYAPSPWSRSTVADGQWMQRNTLQPLGAAELELARCIDATNINIGLSAAAIRGELAASAADLQNKITAEETRAKGVEDALRRDLGLSAEDLASKIIAEKNAREAADTSIRTDLSAYARSTSSHAYDLSKADLDAYKNVINPWKDGINAWSANIQASANDHNTRITAIENADFQAQIDALENANDVHDVVETSGNLNPYIVERGTVLTKNAIIKVLSAGTNNDQQYYYKYTGERVAPKTGNTQVEFSKFSVLGSVQAYYSKSQMDSFLNGKADKSQLNNYLLASDAAATYWPKSCSSDYYKKTETSSNSQLNTKFGDYYNKSTIDTTLNTYMSKTGFNEYSAYADNRYAKDNDVTRWYESDQINYPIKNIIAYDLNTNQDVCRVLFQCTLDESTSHQWFFRKKNDIQLAGKTLQVQPTGQLPAPNQMDPDTYYLV